jgi:hypothetical protein
MTTQSRWTVLTLAGVLIAPGLARADDPPAPDLKPLLAQVRKLVERHYPQGQVTLKDQTIHVEFNTRKFMIHEPTLTGEWQDAWEDVGPQKGGIWADIELRPGEYRGMAAVPQTIDKRYFILLLTATYSKKLDHHLYVHLKYPHGAPKEFVRDFESLINGFAAAAPPDGGRRP